MADLTGIAAAALTGNPLAALGVGGSLTAPTTLASGANPTNNISNGATFTFGGGAGSTTNGAGLPTTSSLLGGTATGTSAQSIFGIAAVIALVGFYLWKKGKL